MLDFKAKMHHNRFRLELRPRPRLGILQCPPGSWKKGDLLLREEERCREGEGEEREGRERERKREGKGR